MRRHRFWSADIPVRQFASACIVCAALFLRCQPASAAQVYVNLVDMGLTAVTNRTVLVSGSSLPRGSSGSVVLTDKRRYLTGTNSFFWISNAVEGVYLVQVLAQPFAAIPSSQTDFRILVTNTSAVIGANSNLVAAAGNTYPSDTVAWGAAASDARYLLRSEAVATLAEQFAQTNWPLAAITNAGTLAYSNAAALSLYALRTNGHFWRSDLDVAAVGLTDGLIVGRFDGSEDPTLDVRFGSFIGADLSDSVGPTIYSYAGSWVGFDGKSAAGPFLNAAYGSKIGASGESSDSLQLVAESGSSIGAFADYSQNVRLQADGGASLGGFYDSASNVSARASGGLVSLFSRSAVNQQFIGSQAVLVGRPPSNLTNTFVDAVVVASPDGRFAGLNTNGFFGNGNGLTNLAGAAGPWLTNADARTWTNAASGLYFMAGGLLKGHVTPYTGPNIPGLQFHAAEVNALSLLTNLVWIGQPAVFAGTITGNGGGLTNLATIGDGAGVVTNNGVVWLVTNAAPNSALPNGSFATTTTGRFFIRTNDTWLEK